ncbi:hypothetical protein MIMGU_mgv1a012137mg [Erythranthe guttata]|uniref:Uncharacterized protein n=1 Tax=Erythranthe guttata TaxID=4155 RepID=A0A022PNY5_ERYGU|nr:hypothetical protein MIMGU_mgv1a012137mg [Erythranthe guttata]
MASRKRSLSNGADLSALYKEWDEASCPICMDHPHNAVLLICTSHNKGCRSYICNTSYRHSNCLDRLRKLKEEKPVITSSSDDASLDHGARKKSSSDSCPSDIDPSRQRAWHRLEDRSEYNDVVSAIHSAVPGAVVVGDYMIEGGGGGGGGGGGEGGGRWLSTLLLFQMMGSMDRGTELRGGRSRVLSRHRRASGSFSRRRYLWGENLLGLQENGDEDDGSEDEEQYVNIENGIGGENDDAPPNPRRRRRLTRARSDENRQ